MATRCGSGGVLRGLTWLRKALEETSTPGRREARIEKKFAVRKTNISAPSSCAPTREIALLIAEPTSELRTGTEVISAVVSGATIIISPTPNRMVPGRKSVKYESGGRYVPGS